VRRIALSLALALTLATAAASCGGSTPNTPTPTPGGGGNGGGGVTPPPNTPPTVKSVTASDTRVEVGTPVTLTANVEDLETPVDNLTYGWTFPATGSASGTGSGRVITWTPSADIKTPADLEITVTVTERVSTNPGGVVIENKVTGTITLHVNNSPKELAELSLRFLGDFANSSVKPDKCVAEFSESTAPCARGKKDELADVDDNRHDFEILSSSLRHTGLSIAGDRLSATVHTACSFTSKVITTQPRDENCRDGRCPLGSIGTATGDCWTTNVYEKGRWWLCESHFTSQSGLLSPFERAFFGIRGGQ
jgi:hypothetical protein